MCGVCGVLAGRDLMSGVDDDHGCILQRNHQGPHEFATADGRRWLWETDLKCDCEHCMEFEGDYCILYWPKTVEVIAKPLPAKLVAPETDDRQIALF